MPEHYSVLEPWAYEGIYRPCLAAVSDRLNAWHFRRPVGALSMEVLMMRLRKSLKRKSTTGIRTALERMQQGRGMRSSAAPARRYKRRCELDNFRNEVDLMCLQKQAPAHHTPLGTLPLPTRQQRMVEHVSALLQGPSRSRGMCNDSQQVRALDLAETRAHDLSLAWDEMTSAEQADALQQDAPIGHRAWEAEGLLRWRGRQRGMPAEESLAVMDSPPYPWATGDVGGNSVGVPAASVSATGTIPGTGGDIPGMPDAWCSLYRVHQYRERQSAVTPAEVRADLFGEQPEQQPIEVTPPDAVTPDEVLEGGPVSESPEHLEDNLTQQMAADRGQQRSADPPAPDAGGVEDSMTQQLAKAGAPEEIHALNTHPLQEDTEEESMRSHPLTEDDDDDDDGDEACGGDNDTSMGVGRCKRILRDGGVLWASQLAAAHDEEGALLLVFYAYLRGKLVKVLVDSGASDNFVSEDCVRRCGLRVRQGPQMKVTLADGSVKTTGAVAYSKFTAPTAAGSTYNESAMAMRVLPLGIRVDVVLGGKWLRSLSPIMLDYAGHGSVSFARRTKGGGKELVTIAGCNPGKSAGGRGDNCAGLIDEVFLTAVQLRKHLLYAETQRLAGDASAQPAWLMMARRDGSEHDSAFAATAAGDHPDAELLAVEAEAVCLSVDTAADAKPVASTQVKLEPPDTGGTAKDIPQDTRDAKVAPRWKEKFRALFEEFSEELRDALPMMSKLRRSMEDEARVTLKPDKEGGPPFRRPYRMSVEELRQLRERIEQLVEKGYIRPSSSPYAAPCLMVPKPGQPNTLRLVVDYRQLNSQTVRDRYPLPDIQLMFDEMQGATHFSSFDAVDGFWQVPMAEEDVEKTAFTTQMGSYEWLVMPQGLQNSPSQYQRRMQRALGHLPFVRIFIDDVVVFSKGGVQEHYDNVRTFLQTCREKGVYLKASKAQMLKESLRFLGHTLSSEGCKPQHDKVAAVRDWPALENVTHVRQFLGLAGYYRRFIHCFSDIAQPLTMLTKNEVEWRWGPEQQWAFEELKAALTDASGVALGGVLMQDCGEGLKVIAYESRQFSAAEQNYHTGERELCGLHHCTTVTWRHYLIFTAFKLQGDHRPLEWLMEPGRELSRRQARWYMDLVEVGVPRMEYVKGALLLVPDALSRRPDYSAKTPREGLKEAGILDAKSDLPKDPLSVLDTSDLFEEGPALGTLTQLAEVNSWLDAVDTLQLAELAMESQLGAKELRAPHHCEDLPIEVAAGAGGVQTQHPGADLPTEVTSDAGGVQMQHPGADLPTEVTSDAGGVQMQHPGADLPTEVTSDAGGVQMQHPGADLPTEVTSDAGGVQVQHPGADLPTEVTSDVEGVQTEHPGADHLTEVTAPPTRGATLAFQRASLKKSTRALRGAFKSLRAMGRSKLPGKAALEMPAEASEQPCGVVASRTRSKTGLPPAGGTSGCQAPVAPAQTPPQVSAKVPMERPSGTVTSRSRSNTKSPPQQEAAKPATPPTPPT
ncbi:hypothetical protein CYMTET_53099 [Cymbomonas tetramitiformis]|uniref:RNA-directed DNA polymerase n=1 Tax=Cymbomonas tetramitiformis TaxID=36881 RepID=A0AAE0BJE9_9CHLO|nr:hypothetical protein CYMTET_53099 [Cymbomonas tetramitiformis]